MCVCVVFDLVCSYIYKGVRCRTMGYKTYLAKKKHAIGKDFVFLGLQLEIRETFTFC